MSLQGKVILITGATSGIGEVTAQVLAEMGATVVIVGRSLERADATVTVIRQRTGNQSVDYLLSDLSSMDQVRQLTRQFKEKYPRLDVLVNNAGAHYFKRHLTVDGYEATFALNHLSYFLLTHLLLDLLKETAQVYGEARVVNVASDAHYRGKIHFDDLMYDRNAYFFGWLPYQQSKLANLLFTFELARRLEGTQVTSNALHPGFVATNLGKSDGSILGRVAMGIAHRFAISPQQGALTSIYLASQPDVRGISGKYYDKCQITQPDPAALDLDTASRLWSVSEALTGI